MIRYRLRIRFRKEGDLRWISHRDLVRLFERMLRRARLKLSMSEGFHPKARMSFPLALALGIEAQAEVMEIELAEVLDPQQVHELLAKHCPPGLVITEVEAMPEGVKKAQVTRFYFEIEVPIGRQQEVSEKIRELLATESVPVHRDDRKKPLDLKADLDSLELIEGRLRIGLRTSRTAAARPREFLAALGMGEIEEEGYILVRSEVELADR